MLNLFSMSSFVQFIGAFHFANVYDPIQKKLFAYFLNVDEKFIDSFGEIRERIQADIQSVKTMDVIETTSGLSTQHTVDRLMEKLSELDKEGQYLSELTKTEVQERFTMGFSRPMFMAFGIYCTFELLVFGWMDMMKTESIYITFAFYNTLVWIMSIYFVICEILKMLKIRIRVFMPTHWDVMIISLLIPFGCWMNHIFADSTFSLIEFPYSFIETMCNSCVLLSVIPFVFVMSFTCIHYWFSLKMIKKNTRGLSQKHKSLHEQKLKMDDMYILFTDEGGPFKFE